MLRLSPDDFWRATPNELSAALEALAEIRGGSGARASSRLGAEEVAELKEILRRAT